MSGVLSTVAMGVMCALSCSSGSESHFSSIVFFSALCVFFLPPARIDLKKKTNEKHRKKHTPAL